MTERRIYELTERDKALAIPEHEAECQKQIAWAAIDARRAYWQKRRQYGLKKRDAAVAALKNSLNASASSRGTPLPSA